MAGYNRYSLDPKPNAKPADFLDVLTKLDRGWAPKGTLQASRELKRPNITQTRPRYHLCLYLYTYVCI